MVQSREKLTANQGVVYVFVKKLVITSLKILSINCLGVISKVEISENSIDTTGPRTVLHKTPFSMKIVKKV